MKIENRLLAIYICLVFIWQWGFVSYIDSGCYSGFSIPYAPLPTAPPSGSTSISLEDDQFSEVIDIGFTFNFFGVAYTQLIIGSNGMVSFNTGFATDTCSYVTTAIPNTTEDTSQNAILFPWVDLYPPGGGTIFYYTTGMAPNRQFVVVFNQVPGFGCNLTNTQGLILYEDSNDIDMVIAEANNCNRSSITAVQGIQDTNGTMAYAVPGRNNTIWTATEDSYRFVPIPIPNLSSSLNPPAICSGTTFSYNPTSDTRVTTSSWTRATVSGITPVGPTSGTNNPNEILINTTYAPIKVTFTFTLTANGCVNTQKVVVIVESAVPLHLRGKQVYNRFATQTDIINVITWKAPCDSNVKQYRIYANSNLTHLIGTISKHENLEFQDHNCKKDKVYTYYVVSEDTHGNLSPPAIISVNPK